MRARRRHILRRQQEARAEESGACRAASGEGDEGGVRHVGRSGGGRRRRRTAVQSFVTSGRSRAGVSGGRFVLRHWGSDGRSVASPIRETRWLQGERSWSSRTNPTTTGPPSHSALRGVSCEGCPSSVVLGASARCVGRQSCGGTSASRGRESARWSARRDPVASVPAARAAVSSPRGIGGEGWVVLVLSGWPKGARDGCSHVLFGPVIRAGEEARSTPSEPSLDALFANRSASTSCG